MECNRQHTGLQGRSNRSALVEQIERISLSPSEVRRVYTRLPRSI